MKKVLLSVSIVAALFFVGCSKDDDGGGKSCADLQAEVTADSEAYGSDPSSENCEALKSSINAYLDKDCGTQEEQDGLESILLLMGDCA